MTSLTGIIERLRSPHADKVFVAAGYTKADLIDDLEVVRAMAALGLEKMEPLIAQLEARK
jgi:hypothetical protein